MIAWFETWGQASRATALAAALIKWISAADRWLASRIA
jgi:hypothetical protein